MVERRPLILDGGVIKELPSGDVLPDRPLDFGIEFAGRPLVSEVIGKTPIVRNTIIPANFAGSYGFVEATPGANFIIDILDDGISIGSVNINTIGVVTFLTVGSTSKVILAGSKLTYIAPAIADLTIIDISITFLGWF